MSLGGGISSKALTSTEPSESSEIEAEVTEGGALISDIERSDKPMLSLQLKEAVIEGDAQKVKALIREGADVNHTNEKGMTVLHLAVMREARELVPILVRAGADVTAQGDDGLTPIGLALGKGHAGILEVLMDGLPDSWVSRYVGPICLFCAVIVHWIVLNILLDPALRWHGWDAIPKPLPEETLIIDDKTVVLISSAMFLLSLTLVNQLDPGTVTPAEVQHIPELKLLPEDEVLMLDDDRFAVIRSETDFDMFRWCHSCEIYRPRNVSHCSKCRRCFWRFDHHCSAVGNCIAARNHRFFTLMLVSAATGWLTGVQGVQSCLLAHGAFSSSELWLPMRVEQWPLYLGLAYLTAGLGACVMVVWASVHTASLFLNFNTKMCLSPSVDKQDRCLNTREELDQLFCMPLRFGRPGGCQSLAEERAVATKYAPISEEAPGGV